MASCCDVSPNRMRPPWIRRMRELVAWIVPSALIVLVPKCPMCLAAYVAVWTGVGLSMTTASYLWWAMLILCVASLLFLIVKRFDRILAFFKHFKKETDSCPTKS